MESRIRQVVISVQLGMTVFFFIAALIAFLFLRDEDSWMLANIWWILLIVAIADLLALAILLKRFRQVGNSQSENDPHG